MFAFDILHTSALLSRFSQPGRGRALLHTLRMLVILVYFCKIIHFKMNDEYRYTQAI